MIHDSGARVVPRALTDHVEAGFFVTWPLQLGRRTLLHPQRKVWSTRTQSPDRPTGPIDVESGLHRRHCDDRQKHGVELKGQMPLVMPLSDIWMALWQPWCVRCDGDQTRGFSRAENCLQTAVQITWIHRLIDRAPTSGANDAPQRRAIHRLASVNPPAIVNYPSSCMHVSGLSSDWL